MARLQADAPADRWVAVTGSLGLRGRRHRKAAIRMLLGQAQRALGGGLLGGGMPGGAGSAGNAVRPGGAGGADGAASGTSSRGGGFTAWAMSQAAPFLMRKADGRVLVWVWKADPELVVVMAQVQAATPQLRAARAAMPIEYDDTEDFRGTYLGVGERLVMPMPAGDRTPPFATYTWDTGTAFVTVTAVCSDRERFGTVLPAIDELARSLRLIDDMPLGESSGTMRINPA